MKVGILAQYLETRVDIRDLLHCLSSKCELVLFLSTGDRQLAGLFENKFEIRYFDTAKYKYRNYITDRLFRLFGKIPKSKQNYFITETFKLQNSRYKKLHFGIESILLNLSRITPKFLSYKKFLSLLKYDSQASIDDINVFFCITQIYEDVFYALIQASGKPVFNYVYSWDHPCKMKCFLPTSNNKYLVWSNQIMEDLISLHSVPEKNIIITGTTQFAYLHNYLSAQKENLPVENKYVYIACAAGNASVAEQEIELIEQLVIKAGEELKDVAFIIRPYPFIKNKSMYDRLKKAGRVEFDTNETTGSAPVENYHRKYTKMQGAFAFVHFGTTLSLEASWLGIPVILADMASGHHYRELNQFVHQYQNDKYLNDANSPNVVHSVGELISGLKTILADNSSYLPYNQKIQQVARPEPLETLAGRFVSLFNSTGV